MIIQFYQAAELEMDEAFIYYEQQLRGLGERFVAAVADTLTRIKTFPEADGLFSKNTRRCLVNTFPYAIIYKYNAAGEIILVVAVAHLHRKSDYWHERKEK